MHKLRSKSSWKLSDGSPNPPTLLSKMHDLLPTRRIIRRKPTDTYDRLGSYKELQRSATGLRIACIEAQIVPKKMVAICR